MRILHISDIHFQTPICLTPDMDPDEAFRLRLEEDLAELCDDGIGVDIILVGGDIAYKAAPGEYAAAKNWLLKLAEICQCPESRVLTVPGNHDVDWNTCAQVSVSNAQEAVAGKNGFHERNRELHRQLGDAASAQALFRPMEAYNEFAAQFQCNVFPERPFWTQHFDLEQDVKLKVVGLTSTLLSGGGGRDKTPGKLFLGERQTVLRPDPDVVTLVLCHHPNTRPAASDAREPSPKPATATPVSCWSRPPGVTGMQLASGRRFNVDMRDYQKWLSTVPGTPRFGYASGTASWQRAARTPASRSSPSRANWLALFGTSLVSQ